MNIRYVLAVVTFVNFSLTTTYGEISENPQMILKASSLLPQRMKSIECSFEVSEISGWSSSIDYIQQNGMYRMERKDRAVWRVGLPQGFVSQNANAVPTHAILAFNGLRYQHFDGATARLGIGDQAGIKYAWPPPQFSAYRWLPMLVGDDSITWTDIANPDWWDDVSERAAWGGVSQNHVFLRIPALEPSNSEYRVYFDPDRNYFPMKFEIWNPDLGKVTLKSTVKQVKEFTVDGERLVFPVDIEYAREATPQTFAMDLQTRVNTSSIRLNHVIAEEAFTIPVTRANFVIDVDDQERLLAEKAERQERRDHPERNSHSWLTAWQWLVIIGILFVSAATAITLRRR